MANIGEETGPPFEEPAPEEWELPGYPVPTTEPAEQPVTEPVTIPVGALHVGDHIRIDATGDLYVIDEACSEWRHLGTARGWFQYWRIASPITATTATPMWTQVGT